ncbi:MAG: hypothetical protein V4454_14975 [Pseudomonadota bacterium]
MTIASGHSGSLASTSTPRSTGLSGHARNGAHRLAVLALLAALALFAVSILLPDNLSQIALDLMSWCLVGALAAGILFAGVRLLESILDL